MATCSSQVKISEKVLFTRSVFTLQNPYANFSKAKVFNSQACETCALLAIFRPFSLLSGRLKCLVDLNLARVTHESPG